MIKRFIRWSLILLVLNQLLPCDALKGFGRGGYGGKYGSKGNKDPQSKTFAGTSPVVTDQSVSDKLPHLTAETIVPLPQFKITE